MPHLAATPLIETDYLEPWIGYIRVSTWKEEKISPEIQEAAILDWAKRNGKRIVRWIIDLDATGRNFKRKIMQGIEAVERGEAKGIGVWKFSRFGRSRDGVAVNLKRVENTGGELVSATEPIDARTAIGRLYRGIIFEFSAYESDRAGEQWTETHQLRRAAGLPATGRKRFGYIWHRRYNPKTEQLQKEWYELDRETAEIWPEAYLKYIAGTGFTGLAGWLNALGYRTTRGALWSSDTVKRAMDSGFPAGLLRVHDDGCKCNNRKTNGTCPNYHYEPGAHEEAIGPEIWQQYLDRRKIMKEAAPKARASTYTLTGLVKCGNCRNGSTTNALTRKNQPTVLGYAYRCEYRAKRGPLACVGVFIERLIVEAKVLEFLAGHAPGIDRVPSVEIQRSRDVQAARSRAEEQRGVLEKQHKELTAALTRLAVDKSINPDNYEEDVYEAAQTDLKRQRDKIAKQLQQTLAVTEQPSFAEFEPVVVGLAEEWDTLLTSERNAIIRRLVRRVALTRTPEGVTVEIHPVWLPDPWAKGVGAEPGVDRELAA